MSAAKMHGSFPVAGLPAVDPQEDDLEYYSRPENYTGSNMVHMQRILLAQQSASSNTVPVPASEDTCQLESQKLIFDRYRQYAFDDTEERSEKNVLTQKTPSAPEVDQSRPRKKAVTVREPPTKTQATPRKASLDRGLSPDGGFALSLAGLSRPQTTPQVSRASSSSPSSDGSRETWRLSARARTSTGANYHSKYTSLSSLLSARDTRQARDRFRHATRIVLILLKWISSLSEKGDGGDGGDGGRTFTDIANEAFTSDELRNSGLSFDVSQFKAKREVNISAEVKMILSIPSHQRTPEQIQTALIGLQHMKSFAEYPLHMQEKLCKVAWFQQVPPKRVIIRQGHYAENFYFILAGQVVVRILDKNPRSGETQLRTAAVMKKGTSFGELALLHHSMRTATVVSQDPVQLLAIGRDDFFDIFMSGSGPDDLPEHIRFVSQLDFMRDWPIQNLLRHPECCLFHFFKRGVVIVKDSHYSDWLYIVKSGSCQVMKELKGVKSNIVRPRQRERHSAGFVLPKLGTGEIKAKVDTGRNRRQCTTPDPAFERPSSRSRHRMVHSAVLCQVPQDDDQDEGASASMETIKPVLLTAPPVHDAPGYSKSRFHKFLTARSGSSGNCGSMPPLPPGPRSPTEGSPPRSGLASPSIRSPRAKTPRKDDELDVPAELRGPVFVQVEVLKPKDAFGLMSIQFDDDVEVPQTSVSLVSNGAECIMLSKKFFCLHANEKVKKRIRYHVRPYPSEVALQENLQNKVDWDIYKKKLIKDMLTQKARDIMLMSGTKT